MSLITNLKTMSCFITTIKDKKYYCLDDFFWSHQYGYVEMTEEEKNSPSPWDLLEYKTLQGRWGTRLVTRWIEK